MNAKRKAKLQVVAEFIADELKAALEELRDEEQEYFDGIPDNLQSGERYERAESALDNLESAISSLEETVGYLEEITNN